MSELVQKYRWLRVLRQPDPWECTVSYICAARSNISTVPKRLEKIAKEFNHRVELEDDVRYVFPTPEEILGADEERLRGLILGQIGRTPRAEVIIDAAKLKSKDNPYLRELAQSDVTYGEAILRLMGCKGIGPKSANCVALFALSKLKAFPVDRWVRQAVRRSYFEKLPLELPLWDEPVVHWAQDYFGPYAGYANQFLFFSERQGDKQIEEVPCTRS